MQSTAQYPLPAATLPVLAALAVLPLIVASPAPAPQCPDGEPYAVRDGRLVCIHGSEEPPPGVDPLDHPSVDELRKERYGDPTFVANVPPVACIGDGRSGPRVQAVYAHASDGPDRYSRVLPLIRQYAFDIDHRINQAAATRGQARRVRYVTEGDPCVLSVAKVTLSPSGDDDLQNTIKELQAKGFNRSDRKYLIWADAAVGICGVAQLVMDDRPGADNANNTGPMYARTDTPCWGYAELHELLHLLGAVQPSAPNSTGVGHCTDDHDTLCYDDGSGKPVTTACADAPIWKVDCNLDDYFNPAPPAGSYLDRHWNAADSSWLAGASTPPPTAPDVGIRAPEAILAGMPFGFEATYPPDRPATRILWETSRRDCDFSHTGERRTVYACPADAGGKTLIGLEVDAVDGAIGEHTRTLQIVVPRAPRPMRIGVEITPRVLVHGGASAVTARLVDRATGKPVFGMPLELYALPHGSRDWEPVRSEVTDLRGIVRLPIQPDRKTAYQLVSGSSPTWAETHSPVVKVGVRPRVEATADRTLLPVGTTTTISGRVFPAHPGGLVELQRHTADGWRKVGETVEDGTGQFTFVIERITESGEHAYRAVKPADADHLNGASDIVLLTAR